MEHIRFERAVARHRDDFARLMSDFYQYEVGSPMPLATLDKLLQDVFDDNPPVTVWMAAHDQEYAGFATVVEKYSTYTAKPTWFIEDLFIAEAFRRRGIGRAFFEFLKTRAQEENCIRIDWNCYPENVEAHRFYDGIKAKNLNKLVFRLEVQNG